MSKKSSPAKQSKVTKKNVTKKRFNLPKLNSRSYMLGLTALLLFSVVGAYSYQASQNNQIKAKAAGWTTTYSWCSGTGCVKIQTCKIAESGGYGPVWRLKHYVINNSSDTVSSYYYIKRGSSTVDSSYVYSTRGTYKSGKDIYASRVYNDTFYFLVKGTQIGNPFDSGLVWMAIDNISYC